MLVDRAVARRQLRANDSACRGAWVFATAPIRGHPDRFPPQPTGGRPWNTTGREFRLFCWAMCPAKSGCGTHGALAISTALRACSHCVLMSGSHGIAAMPQPTPPVAPSKRPRMMQAAIAGMLITVKCGLCRRQVNYWAADLVEVLGPQALADVPPYPCSRCRAPDMLSVRRAVPSASELAEGKIVVRRPVRQIVKWTWRNERA